MLRNVSGRELTVVVVLLAIGTGLRAAWPSRMAVEHFDEGVYASNLYSPLTDYRYPDQFLYAPPLLPFLLEWGTILGGPHGAMWVNVASGSLTLLAAWSLVRGWWGPRAAAVALTLLALNEFHIAYSRAALTDALLCLWLTLGIGFGVHAIFRGGTGNIVAAAGCAALAWWTKYNGWLTLAISGAGTLGWIGGAAILRSRRSMSRIPPPGERPSDLSAITRWLSIAALSFLVWCPWLIAIKDRGGYSAVAANHSGYFAGRFHWPGNALRQLSAVSHMLGLTDIWPAIATIAAALLMAVCFTCDETPGDGMPRSRRNDEFRMLTIWITAAWVLSLTLAIPLYQPYPRLALPWMVGVIVAVAGTAEVGWQWMLTAAADRRTSQSATVPGVPSGSRSRAWAATTGAAALLLCAGVALSRVSASAIPPAWQDRTEVSAVAGRILERLSQEPLQRTAGDYDVVIYVVEPGLFFHLAAAQVDSPIRHLTQAASNLGMARPGGHRSSLSAYLVMGAQAPAEDVDALVAAGRLTPVTQFEDHPSDLVLLDAHSPVELAAHPEWRTKSVRLFQVHAGATDSRGSPQANAR